MRREACPPARRPRHELRSARRLEARPGPAGLAPPSSRAASTTWPCHRPPAPQPPSPRRPRTTLQSGGYYHLALPPPSGTAATFTPQASRHPPVGRPLPPDPAATHRRRSNLKPAGLAPIHSDTNGGFCSIRSSVLACRRRVGVLMALFPPLHVTWAAGRDQQHSPSAPPHDDHRLSLT